MILTLHSPPKKIIFSEIFFGELSRNYLYDFSEKKFGSTIRP